MQVFRSQRWSALAVLFVFAAPAARAGMIIPDSIPNPPNAVGSANGTPISTSNIVVRQYAGLGLNFNAAAITSLNGVPVWAPVSIDAGTRGGAINYATSVGGIFVVPGSSNPTSVSSLSVKFLGNLSLSMSVYGLNGMALNINPAIRNIMGGQIWTFTGTNISSFYATQVPPPGYGQPAVWANPEWGVAEVSFTPASTPEPSSLVLAGLGALGLATRLGWRRSRRFA